jgi:hypothetical protein
MKKVLFLMFLPFLLLGTSSVNAQVRIGGQTAPNLSAILDLNPDAVEEVEQDATKGLLLPKVRLISRDNPAPLPAHVKGIMVYNKNIIGELNEGVYFNSGVKWFPVISDESVNASPPIIFLRQPGFLWLGNSGEITDTLGFELAAVDKSKFSYQWYKRDPVTLVSTPLETDDAQKDTIIINSVNKGTYGITELGKVYQFYCVVVSGSQYGISGTGRVIYGPGAWLANGKWIKIANANLGADQTKTIADQITYTPEAESSGEANDKAYDPTVYGDWYQWGRKKDSHQDRKVLGSGTYSGYLNTDGGVETDKLNANDGQIKDTENNIYGKFIQRNAGTLDWRQYPEADGNFLTSPANAWTWGNPVDGVTDQDPCRSELGAGWRVPTQAEWSQIISNNT